MLQVIQGNPKILSDPRNNDFKVTCRLSPTCRTHNLLFTTALSNPQAQVASRIHSFSLSWDESKASKKSQPVANLVHFFQTNITH